jgi:hypothetical protein
MSDPPSSRGLRASSTQSGPRGGITRARAADARTINGRIAPALSATRGTSPFSPAEPAQPKGDGPAPNDGKPLGVSDTTPNGGLRGRAATQTLQNARRYPCARVTAAGRSDAAQCSLVGLQWPSRSASSRSTPSNPGFGHSFACTRAARDALRTSSIALCGYIRSAGSSTKGAAT